MCWFLGQEELPRMEGFVLIKLADCTSSFVFISLQIIKMHHNV